MANDTLACPLCAGLEVVLKVLREEAPPAGEISSSQVAGGDPVLDDPHADIEDGCDIAVAVHRLKGQVAARKQCFEQWVLRCF